MASRTTRSIVRFTGAFRLHGVDAPQPAGEYEIEHDGGPIEGVALNGHGDAATYIHLPAISVPTLSRQRVAIDPADLDLALAKDREQR
jgi:hypothetical protein